MKYLVLLLVLAGLAWWWLERRRAVIRARRQADAKLLPMELVACPKCGVYAPRDQHRCG